MNELPLFGLGGNVLLVVILGLLFAEEAGAPLFFIAGDLLLAVGGIAIASGQLSPLVFIPAAFFALVAGALVGWELFSRLGWDRLFSIARRLHAGGVLQRAARLLHNAGWRAVFVSRLIPGLRIYTTQIAAVSGMPRRPSATNPIKSFMAGWPTASPRPTNAATSTTLAPYCRAVCTATSARSAGARAPSARRLEGRVSTQAIARQPGACPGRRRSRLQRPCAR